MDILGPQLRSLLADAETRRNLHSLVRLLGVVGLVVVLWSMLFHVVMAYEGQDHSLLTGLYWTLVAMTTLGLGDIVFVSDLGRMFTSVVLVSGITLLFVVFPFAFIRYFYAPWTEAQARWRAPREVPPGVDDHVIICLDDPLARGLIERLRELEIAYYLIEPDATAAARMHLDGISVVYGERDDPDTYRRLRAGTARLIVANLDPPTNTNVTLSVRQDHPDVPIAAIADDPAAAEILELAGATHVLPLKEQLGDQLASRVNAGRPHAHIDSHVSDLVIAEFPVAGTPLSGRTIRDSRLREVTGVNVVACWENGRLVSAHADKVLGEGTTMLVVGTTEQVAYLDAAFVIYATNDNPVIVVGGGNVGFAVVRTLNKRDVRVVVIERDPSLEPALAAVAERVIIGDAASRDVLMQAGIDSAPSLVLASHDDATNIYLAVYCRSLNPKLRIISRVTHARNIPAVRRSGADFTLSYGSLGVKSIVSLLQNMQLVVIEEGGAEEDRAGALGLFLVAVPDKLAGKKLGESGISARTGLSVLAIQKGETVVTNPSASTELLSDAELLMLGTSAQREQFVRTFA